MVGSARYDPAGESHKKLLDCVKRCIHAICIGQSIERPVGGLSSTQGLSNGTTVRYVSWSVPTAHTVPLSATTVHILSICLSTCIFRIIPKRTPFCSTHSFQLPGLELAGHELRYSVVSLLFDIYSLLGDAIWHVLRDNLAQYPWYQVRVLCLHGNEFTSIMARTPTTLYLSSMSFP